jgi:RNA polymerase sigma-70 factor, ECF subfamily
VTSAVFENAVRYRDTYDPTKGEPIAWLLGIARRSLAQAFADRAEEPRELDRASASTEFENETIERLTLDSALATLGERDQELIALRYGADLRARQIADVVGLTTNAVEVALHRALTKLRAALEAQEGEPEAVPVLDRNEGPV